MKDKASGKLEHLRERFSAILAAPGMELSSIVAAVINEDGTMAEASVGRRYIDSSDSSLDLPATSDTLYRVASISKMASGLMAMMLADEGSLDLDRDISEYLGFILRNPAYPDAVITAAMLLSHVSSIRDTESYSMPLGGGLCDFFTPGGSGWEDGAHFASPDASGRDHAPGLYYTYCNLGYGVLATAMETVTGERFDTLIRRRLLEPLSMEAAHNVNLLTDDAFGRLAPIYRKERDRALDPDAPWKAQADDYRGKRPSIACALSPGYQPADLERYQPGTNGTLFSPQGGMRASILDLARLLSLFIGRGAVAGRRIVSEASMRRMMTPAWRYDEALENGDTYHGLDRECGLALMHVTNDFDRLGGNRLRAGGGPPLWGHHADAYGLHGAIMFDAVQGYGFAYLVGGTSVDPELYRGKHSSYFVWEGQIQEALLDCLSR